MFYGMMRVKNEARWIAKSLESLLEVCDQVFILDDHSTDGTDYIVRSVDDGRGVCTLIRSSFATLDEARDKTYLLRKIEEDVADGRTMPPNPLSPHWVICIDGDEEIVETDFPQLVWESLGMQWVSYSFQILTLYDAPDQIRVDGVYNAMFRPSMFRLIKPGMVFRSNGGHGGGLHCSNVPADIGYGVTVHDPVVRVKHYGYMGKGDRERKYKWYVERDPGHEDWYRRECFGEPKLVKLPEGL